MAEGKPTSAPPPPSGRRPRAKRPRAKRPRAEKPAAPGRLARLYSEYRGGLVWALLALGSTLAIALLVLLIGYGRSHAPAKSPAAIEVDWPADATSEDAADKLAELGLVSNAETMAVFLRATGGTRDFVAGVHFLPTGASPWELRRLLSRSILRPSARLVVPEGFTRFDIGARLEKLRIASKRSFVSASADVALLAELGLDKDLEQGGARVESTEGFLFPATYELALDSDPREITRTLLATNEKRWQALAAQHEAGIASLRASLGWGRREIVILASIIEKEAAVDEERPIIASVFLNRLLDPVFRPKRLQSDPTSSYGCVAWPDEAPSCKAFNGKPTPAINRDPLNRYSTYVRTGLPPGPISNPGVRSLEAVLAPAATKYLYFVAAGGGRHTFSETLDAHNDAVNRGRAP